jgi:hypothetical protein
MTKCSACPDLQISLFQMEKIAVCRSTLDKKEIYRTKKK